MTRFFTSTLVLLLITFASCKTQSPDLYYSKTTKSTDIFWGFGSKDLKSFIEFRDANNLVAIQNNRKVKTISIQEHIETFLIPNIESYIMEIESLKPTEETKDMINASLALYNFAHETYKNDYIAIAQLIDNREDATTIQDLMIHLDQEKRKKLKSLYQDLMQTSVPYAKQHDLTVSRF